MEYNLQQSECEIVVQPSQGELIWNPQKLGDTSRYLVFISHSNRGEHLVHKAFFNLLDLPESWLPWLHINVVRLVPKSSKDTQTRCHASLLLCCRFLVRWKDRLQTRSVYCQGLTLMTAEISRDHGANGFLSFVGFFFPALYFPFFGLNYWVPVDAHGSDFGGPQWRAAPWLPCRRQGAPLGLRGLREGVVTLRYG